MTQPRALTLLNEQGDVTLVWGEEDDDRMLAVITNKMAQGVVFFIIEPRFFGLLPAKRTALSDADQALKHRALAVRDEDFAKFIGESVTGTTVATPAAPVKSVRKAKSAKEVAGTQSVGVKPMRGG